jgi:hypothetical protein
VISATTAYRHIRRRLAATSVVAPFLAGRFDACIREAFLGLSMDISPMTREQLGTMVATEWTRMGKVVAASGAKID